MLNDKDRLIISLNKMKDMRKELIADVMNKSPDLFEGLHSTDNNEVFQLYMEKFKMMWLDKHWYSLNDDIQKNRYGELYQKEKESLIMYFSSYFKDFLSHIKSDTKIGSQIYMEFIKIKIHTLDDLISINDRNEKNLAQLKTDMKKHKEEYNELIKNTK